jgi:hypothetical protein
MSQQMIMRIRNLVHPPERSRQSKQRDSLGELISSAFIFWFGYMSELMSKGETNQSEIARTLQVDRSMVCRDVTYLRQQAKEYITRYVDERLPEEYEKC